MVIDSEVKAELSTPEIMPKPVENRKSGVIKTEPSTPEIVPKRAENKKSVKTVELTSRKRPGDSGSNNIKNFKKTKFISKSDVELPTERYLYCYLPTLICIASSIPRQMASGPAPDGS